MLTNYIGPSILLEEAANILLRNNMPSVIVGISSISGERGRAKNYFYGSAKAGFTQFLSGLRQKLNNTNVHVMTVKPGYVRTKMLKNTFTPNFLSSNPEDIAKLIIRSINLKKNVVYGWKWKIIITILKIIPEFIFKKMKF